MLYIHIMIKCTTFMYGIYAKRSKITSKEDGKFENIIASKVIYHTNNEK